MEKYTKEQLQEIISNCNTKADFCRALGLNPIGGSYRTIDGLIKKYELEYNFTVQPWNKGKKVKTTKRSLEEILVKDSPHKNSYSLKMRLFKEGLKENRCEICGCTTWEGQEITLELHHINGDHYDNRLENLQILCPNCHSKTENFRIKNSEIFHQKRKILDPKELYLSEEEVQQREIKRKAKKINKTVEEYLEYKKERKIRKKLQLIKCPICGKEFYPRDSTSKYCSQECYRFDNKGNRPTLVQLLKDFEELSSFVQVGNKYNVSDNAVRKWCKLYGIPTHTKELHEYLKNPDMEIKNIKRVRSFDYDKIVEVYTEGNTIKDTAKIIGCSTDTVSKALKEKNIKVNKTFNNIIVHQYTLSDEYVQTFNSYSEISDWLINNNLATSKMSRIHVKNCCEGVAKSAYGYIWKLTKD